MEEYILVTVPNKMLILNIFVLMAFAAACKDRDLTCIFVSASDLDVTYRRNPLSFLWGKCI